jgi:hypothetical protein
MRSAPRNELVTIMTTEPPLTLREVALLLGKIVRLPNGKPDVRRLLALLKAEELNAGFEYPGIRMYWIRIPKSYWAGVNSRKFGVLWFRTDDPRTGTYQVRIADFADEFFQVVSQEAAGTDAVLEEMKKALSAARRRYEVVITNVEWTKYLERNQIPTSALQKRSYAGRPPKDVWHQLAPIIAAQVITLDKQILDSRDYSSIAKSVYALANEEGIKGLPIVDTIKDVISKAFAQAEKLSRL